jgi:hypothetical protein
MARSLWKMRSKFKTNQSNQPWNNPIIEEHPGPPFNLQKSEVRLNFGTRVIQLPNNLP